MWLLLKEMKEMKEMKANPQQLNFLPNSPLLSKINECIS